MVHARLTGSPARDEIVRLCCGLLFAVVFVCFAAVTSDANTLLVPRDYPSIQAAITISENGDRILVSPGTYHESINFHGKAITVRSTHGPLVTTITNERTVDLVTFDHGETPSSVLYGFTLQGGWIAVMISNSAPTISHNVCRDQNVWNWAAICICGNVVKGFDVEGGDPRYSPEFGEAPAVIINNTIVNSANGGISEFSITPPTIKNNIVAFNGCCGIHLQATGNQQTPIMGYNNVYGNPDANFYNIADRGPGALSTDPLFGDDYVLSSSSPCVDAGDPDPMYNDPGGSRSDIGALSTDPAPSSCCAGRVGNVGGSDDEEPSIGDVVTLIDAKFITGDCVPLLDCLAEADINQSGGYLPLCSDIGLADISMLIDYLFITGPSVGLPDCM